MRTLIQRVKQANVSVSNSKIAEIEQGLLIFLGIEDADTAEDIDWLCSKISKLRIFDDEEGVMNCSVVDIKGEIIVVSQFTLHASTKKGNRPSYIRAAKPDISIPLYKQFVKVLSSVSDCVIQTGEFGAMMDVELINDGPITIMIDSKNRDF